MTPEPKIIEHRIGDRSISFETGHVAEQANGALFVRSGDTMLLVTATMSKHPRPGIDFLPLTCDYEEKIYAAGRIPGSFFRREGRPGEQGILNSRLIDRPLRPLFDKDLRLDVQVVATVLSVDQEADPATMAINGASAGAFDLRHSLERARRRRPRRRNQANRQHHLLKWRSSRPPDCQFGRRWVSVVWRTFSA